MMSSKLVYLFLKFAFFIKQILLLFTQLLVFYHQQPASMILSHQQRP